MSSIPACCGTSRWPIAHRRLGAGLLLKNDTDEFKLFFLQGADGDAAIQKKRENADNLSCRDDDRSDIASGG
ncbi:hypothetical protein ACMYR3_03660 [Ampullimonas aquatilis]|uniref:hypothetical protein n=1 Tax=Ampullimonas aquatilis TaxID=1341549 RepID=UPI003C70EDD4